MNTEPNVKTPERLAELKTKVEEMHKRTLAAVEPLKVRYAELHSQLKLLEREIRALDEDWEPAPQ